MDKIGKGPAEAVVKRKNSKKRIGSKLLDIFRLTSAKQQRLGGRSSPVTSGRCFIVARVGDHVITNLDIWTAICFVFFSAGKEVDKEAARRMVPSVLAAKIDNALRCDVAERAEVTVTDDDVKEHIRQMATWNEITEQELLHRLNKFGIGKESFEQMAREQIIYSIMLRLFASEMKVSPKEIAAEKMRLEREQRKKRFKISEIYLALSEGTDIVKLRVVAQNVKRLLDSGFSFQVLAGAISQSRSVGSEENWITEDAMDPQERAVARRLTPGGFSEPIETSSGIKFISVIDVAEAGHEGDSAGAPIVLRALMRCGGELFTRADAESFDAAVTSLSKASSSDEYKRICKKYGLQWSEAALTEPTERETRMVANSRLSGNPCIAQLETDQNALVVLMYSGTQRKKAEAPSDETARESLAANKRRRIAATTFNKLKSQLRVTIYPEYFGTVVQ
ncbi:MAG: peptidylprolyl isomerase [Holosporales bacterium]|jgi:peptidyl-prolyl cis-trans isomerase SurA|nr:peptidylprolyl isomerase [Holosporales bacterium]